MIVRRSPSIRLLHGAIAVALLFFLQGPAAAQDAPIVQPGAPGKAGRAISADEAVKIADTSYSVDDARFMQDMITHHQQAVRMAALVESRSNRAELQSVAGRIDASQADEIRFMQQWLRDRGEEVRDPADAHTAHQLHAMAGMASPEQLASLEGTKDVDFDRLFLELMIRHHEGAVKMVDHLLKQPGSAYDPVLFEFVGEVRNGQRAEIARMNALLAGLSTDPRVNLKAGFKDAGEAISNLTLVAALPKPAGFFDPKNPADLPPPKPQKDAKTSDRDPDNEDTAWGPRSPLLSFGNTDMAFKGDLLYAGNYHGFNVYRLGADGVPKHVSSVVCPGGQGDVSIVGDLLIMSVEQTRGRVDCGLEGVNQDVSRERFRGLRIFDIRDPARPVQVGQVQTCRGSHTHSVVSGPGADGKIIVYNSGVASVRDSKELPGCVGPESGDDRTALFRIDVIEIPVADPSKARIVDSPAVFADPETGRLAGLWPGGSHGEGTQETSVTDQCHDITVFPSKKIAAGACSGNGILFDISDPRKPKRLDAVTDKGFAYWHSATFNNDGTKVIFTDEWGGGTRPRCRASDPTTWGADAIYDIVDGKLEFRGHFKLPAPQSDEENCVAHNGSVVPVPGRDIFVQAWYQGGVSVIDFTDSSKPTEIAYFDRGPIDKEHLVLGGYWSTYWYKGKIYGTEIVRGLDVLSLTPSDHFTANELAAATLAGHGEIYNPQDQFPVTWPADPAVARAYIDQLDRSGTLAEGTTADLRSALDRAATHLVRDGRDAGVGARLTSLAAMLGEVDGDALARRRLSGLVETLNGIAARLR